MAAAENSDPRLGRKQTREPVECQETIQIGSLLCTKPRYPPLSNYTGQPLHFAFFRLLSPKSKRYFESVEFIF
jgi:hypothetical protein